MDDCLSRIIVQSIKDELGHWDDQKEEQCETEFVYGSGEDELPGSCYPAAARNEVYPIEGCGSFATPPHDDTLISNVVKKEWEANPIKEERPDMVSFSKGFGGPVPATSADPPLLPGCWNGGSAAVPRHGWHHSPDPLAVEYIELKPKAHWAELAPRGESPQPPEPERGVDHRPELAYVLVERLPLRVIKAWLPRPRIDLLKKLMQDKRKHSSLSLEKKLKILRDVELLTLPKKDIAKKYKIPQSTLSTLIKNREKIEDMFMLGGAPGRYRARGAKHKEIEAKLFEYFTNVRSQNVYLSGQMLQEEAGRIAVRLQIDDFAASSGWLWRFQKRYNIVTQTLSNESENMVNDQQEEWLRSVRHIIDKYHPKDMFNMDELALFYNSTPDRTTALRSNKCHGGEKSKDRLTVALTCNADGSEKLEPLVVGKFDSPRCFRRADRSLLPCTYRSSKKSWMTSSIFLEWLGTLQRGMADAGRKILLVLDNCKAHALDGTHFPNVRVLLLPPNMNDRSHPLNQGIVHSFKRTYRQRLLRHYLQQVRRGVALDALHKWDTLDAICNVVGSWRAVSPATVERCWARSGLIGNETDSDPASDLNSPDNGYDLTATQLLELGIVNFETLVTVDDDVLTSSVYEFDCEDVKPAISLANVFAAEAPPCVPPPSPHEVRSAVEVLNRVAATCKAPANVLRAIRVLNKYAADVSKPIASQW